MGFGRDPLGFQVMKQGCRGLRVHLDTGGSHPRRQQLVWLQAQARPQRKTR